ncbi:cell wall hydrolase [Erythrobacter sp. EC-HK427]|uniref:cell wall hydrolase n=1 Tax=Erythrobacter sp. EC-HK427 TaxID=2038396 RepID=UPI001256921C|nr:conserved exported hypothetical protein [Erythrobacter sp. EC-HK427]
MTIVTKRVGAIALATTLFAGSFGAVSSGATAQDRALAAAEQQQAETASTRIQTAQTEADPEIRFVPREVVQDIPDSPETPAAEEATYSAESLRQLVAQIDTSEDMSREMMCLAQAIYFESRGEPLEGQLAVARVIINRAESNRFPDDYCAVVTQPSQFSFVRGGSIPSPNTGSAAWTRAKAIARIAHGDLWESPVGDALYFHATHVRPSWAGRLSRRAQIDNHIFYR